MNPAAKASLPCRSLIPVQLFICAQNILELRALTDSGADETLMDHNLVNQLLLQRLDISESHQAHTLDDHLLGRITTPISLYMAGNHVESISFLDTDSPHYPLILGYLRFCKHNPQINWVLGDIRERSPACQSFCLLSQIKSTNPSEFPDPSEVPEVYQY